VCNHSSNHLYNISEIRTRAIELVNVFEMEFRWEKDMLHILLSHFCSVLIPE
jgi:hypothetical protein